MNVSFFVPPEPDLLAKERVQSATQQLDNDAWPVTCQVRIDVPSDSTSGWILTSLDCQGKEKTKGGDEFYISFTAADRNEEVQPYSAVALVEDQQDGTYKLNFYATPTSPRLLPAEEGGRLTIYFQYSCGIGAMPSPTKKDWSNGGYTHRRYDLDLERGPPIRPFVCPPAALIDLSPFDLIVAFGDSTMEQLVRQRPNKKGKYFFQKNISYGEKVTFGLNTQTVSSFLDLLEQGSGRHLRDEATYPRRAVLLGSSLWDILDSKDMLQGSQYEDHQKAIHLYLEAIRQRYPNVTILWKSPTAVHIHVVDLERLVLSKMGEAALFGIERIRYMSASRSKYLYQIQKAIMQEQGIAFLDLYEATYLSADWLFPSDGRHYRPDLNRLMLQWFYPPSHEGDLEVTSDDKGGMMLTIPKPYYRDPTQQQASYGVVEG